MKMSRRNRRGREKYPSKGVKYKDDETGFYIYEKDIVITEDGFVTHPDNIAPYFPKVLPRPVEPVLVTRPDDDPNSWELVDIAKKVWSDATKTWEYPDED
jgi:hypothetical protein